MFKTLRSAWALEDLRKKMIFTMMILLLYRIINVIPVPFVDTQTMSEYFNSSLNSTILGLYNAMSGFGLAQASMLALGIQPYINASIIIQLLTVAIPALERMAKEQGEIGKKKIEKITRIATVAIGVLLGFAYYTMISNANGYSILTQKGVFPAIVIITTFTAGSCFVMWLGEQINAKGIGNGISMILFANILSGFPNMISSAIQGLQFGIAVDSQAGTQVAMFQWWQLVIIGVVLAAVTVFIIYVNDAERRIPIQYAKRVVGRKVYGGQSTNLPIKVSMSGGMPVIFASSIISVPATICTFIGKKGWWYWNVFHQSSWIYVILYTLLIFFFSWFYSTIQYDPVEISNNLKKNGGFIPGFRPGKPTADFIKKVISKILVFGAVYLSVVALLPMVGSILIPAAQSLAIGGTSVIIVVGVALETVKALEAQMMMRHYKGFLD